MDFAFERYFDTAGLFGTPAKAMGLVEQLRGIGVDELACLVDFGVAADTVLAHLDDLAELMRLAQSATVDPAPAAIAEEDAGGVVDQILRRGVTHLQCTPSMVRMLLADPRAPEALGRLERLLVGGEALPADLAEQVAPLVGGRMINMYGPTETTVWSTTAPVVAGRAADHRATDRQHRRPRARLAPAAGAGRHARRAAASAAPASSAATSAGRTSPPSASSTTRSPRAGACTAPAISCAVRDDGRIEFLGRIDHQVKVNGYRIELGEIEAVLGRHPAVHEAVVVARDAPGGGSQLAAYVVPSARPRQRASAPTSSTSGSGCGTRRTRRAPATTTTRPSCAARPMPASTSPAGTARRPASRSPPRRCASGSIAPSTGCVGLAPTRRAGARLRHRAAAVPACCRTSSTTRPSTCPSTPWPRSRPSSPTTSGARSTCSRARPTASPCLPARSTWSSSTRWRSTSPTWPTSSGSSSGPWPASPTAVRSGSAISATSRLLDAFQAEVQLTQAPADLPAADLRSRLRTRVEREGELLVDPLLFDVLAARIPRDRRDRRAAQAAARRSTR